MKYQWEAKPPLTRADLFSDGWEIGSIDADSDEKAIAWATKMFQRHSIGGPLTIRVMQDGRLIRTLKT
jgi:hypothetical protein